MSVFRCGLPRGLNFRACEGGHSAVAREAIISPRMRVGSFLLRTVSLVLALLMCSEASAQGFASLSPGGAAPAQERSTADAPASLASMPVAPVAASMSDVADKVVVRKGERRLYLLRQDQVIAEYPVHLGLNPYGPKEREGDFRTPEGVYTLSRRNPRSEFFLSIQVSYPNFADLARARAFGLRPGGLIMIHGEPNVPRKPADYYARNDWTDGCIALSNTDMLEIWLRTADGIPIEIHP